MRLSVSDISAYLNCRRKWVFGSKNALGKEPSYPKTALFLGRGIHRALEAAYQPNDINYARMVPVFNEWFESELKAIDEAAGMSIEELTKDDLLESHELGVGMLINYEKWLTHFPESLIPVAPEQEFKIDIPGTNSHLIGFLDLVFRSTQDGSLWLMEFKTTSRSLSDLNQFKYLNLDFQASVYVTVAEQVLQEPISGIVYTFLAKRTPTIPRVLKSGRISKDSRIRTTLFHFLESMERHGIPDDDPSYETIISKLCNQKFKGFENFFYRHIVDRTTIEKENIRNQVKSIALEMEANHQSFNDNPLAAVPTPTMFCPTYCSYFDPCLKMQRGEDWKYELEVNYRDRE